MGLFSKSQGLLVSCLSPHNRCLLDRHQPFLTCGYPLNPRLCCQPCGMLPYPANSSFCSGQLVFSDTSNAVVFRGHSAYAMPLKILQCFCDALGIKSTSNIPVSCRDSGLSRTCIPLGAGATLFFFYATAGSTCPQNEFIPLFILGSSKLSKNCSSKDIVLARKISSLSPHNLGRVSSQLAKWSDIQCTVPGHQFVMLSGLISISRNPGLVKTEMCPRGWCW